MTKIQSILYWIPFIIIMAIYNWYLIKKLNKHPDYDLHNLIKLIIGFIFLILTRFNLWFIPYAFFSYGFIFDPLLNILRKEPLLYLGSGSNSAKTDRWELKLVSKGLPLQAIFFLEGILALFFMNLFYVGGKGFIQQIQGTYNWDNFLW